MQEKLIVSKASAQVAVDLQENQRLQDVRLVAFLDIMGFKDMVARHFSLIETSFERWCFKALCLELVC